LMNEGRKAAFFFVFGGKGDSLKNLQNAIYPNLESSPLPPLFFFPSKRPLLFLCGETRRGQTSPRNATEDREEVKVVCPKGVYQSRPPGRKSSVIPP